MSCEISGQRSPAAWPFALSGAGETVSDGTRRVAESGNGSKGGCERWKQSLLYVPKGAELPASGLELHRSAHSQSLDTVKHEIFNHTITTITAIYTDTTMTVTLPVIPSTFRRKIQGGTEDLVFYFLLEGFSAMKRFYTGW